MLTKSNMTKNVPALLPDRSGCEGNSKSLFLRLKNNINTTVPPCSPISSIKEYIKSNIYENPHDTHAHAYIYNNRAQRGNTGTFFKEQSHILHNYFYDFMLQFRSAWRSKWDAVLQKKDWPKIKTLCEAIFKVHPGNEQDILRPGVEQLEPWFPIPRDYDLSVYLLLDGERIPREDGTGDKYIGLTIRATSREEAIENIPKWYEYKPE